MENGERLGKKATEAGMLGSYYCHLPRTGIHHTDLVLHFVSQARKAKLGRSFHFCQASAYLSHRQKGGRFLKCSYDGLINRKKQAAAWDAAQALQAGVTPEKLGEALQGAPAMEGSAMSHEGREEACLCAPGS